MNQFQNHDIIGDPFLGHQSHLTLIPTPGDIELPIHASQDFTITQYLTTIHSKPTVPTSREDRNETMTDS